MVCIEESPKLPHHVFDDVFSRHRSLLVVEGGREHRAAATGVRGKTRRRGCDDDS